MIEEISEAEWLGGEDAYEDKEVVYKLSNETAYKLSKSSKVGAKVICPSCEKSFIKKSCQQAFCNNKGRGNCKDRYWNSTVGRIDRTILFLDNTF